MFTVEQAARMYRVPLIDMERPGTGVLVSSGCGIMMAVLDYCAELRWCVDYDALPKAARLGDFMLMAERAASIVAICGWFSYTDPAELRAIVASMRERPPVVYGGNVKLSSVAEPASLDAFLRALDVRREEQRLPKQTA